MSLLPEGASFQELVQDYFLALRGAGLMLSPLDAQLLADWAAQDVPFEVVARGLTRSAEKALFDARPGEPVLRSLRACRRQVDAEIKKYLSRRAGANVVTEPAAAARRPKTWEDVRHARLCATLEQLAAEAPALHDPVVRLLVGPLKRAPADPAGCDAQEALAFLVLLRAMPLRNRVALWRAAREGAQGAGLGVSHRARLMSRRFRVIAQVRRRLGLSE